MIEIKNYEPIHNATGCKVATFDVVVNTPNSNYTVRNMSLLRKNERSWVNPPQTCKEIMGKKEFTPLFELNDPEANKALLNAIATEVQNIPTQSATPQPTVSDAVPF